MIVHRSLDLHSISLHGGTYEEVADWLASLAISSPLVLPETLCTLCRTWTFIRLSVDRCIVLASVTRNLQRPLRADILCLVAQPRPFLFPRIGAVRFAFKTYSVTARRTLLPPGDFARTICSPRVRVPNVWPVRMYHRLTSFYTLRDIIDSAVSFLWRGVRCHDFPLTNEHFSLTYTTVDGFKWLGSAYSSPNRVSFDRRNVIHLVQW